MMPGSACQGCKTRNRAEVHDNVEPQPSPGGAATTILVNPKLWLLTLGQPGESEHVAYHAFFKKP